MGFTHAICPVRLTRLMRGTLLALSLCPGVALWAQPSEGATPAVAMSAAAVASEAAALIAPGPQDKLAAIQISGVDFSYLPASAERGGTGQLFVLGMVRNAGGEKFSDPVLQARFYDSQGQLVDALTDSFFRWSVLPGMRGVVRLDGQARYPADRYARVELHVMGGDWEGVFSSRDAARTDCADCESGSHWNWLEDLRTWWPFILILLLWGVYGLVWQRRAQRRGNGLWQQQMDLLARQTEAQEKIARASAEKTSTRPADTTE